MSCLWTCLLLFISWSALCRQDVGANVWRKSLQKEVLLNSISYLRYQLFTCLKVTESGRGKRKAANDWYHELRLQMDVDILKNSENYLMNRVVDCRIRLTSGHVIDDVGGLDRVMSSSAEGRQSVWTKTGAAGPQPSGYDKNVFSSGYNVARKPSGSRVEAALSGRVTERLVSGYNTDSIVSGNDVNRDRYLNEDVSDPLTAPPTEIPVTEPSTQYQRISPTTTHKPEASFLLDGRFITCDTVYIISNTFQCRNLRVNGNIRLPNMDYCPPHYDVNRWRSMDDMSDRTRDAIDLLDLCATIGQKLNVSGYTKHVRVVWECDKVTPRMKWQNGRWAGMIKDNGYLHDLECTYSGAINQT